MSRRHFFFLTLCAASLAGCERSSEPLVVVTGNVLYRRVPLHTGTVVFTPDAARGGSGPAAHAEIQKDGGYRLRTSGADGVPVGWHRVTVLAVEMPTVQAPPDQFVIPRSLVP